MKKEVSFRSEYTTTPKEKKTIKTTFPLSINTCWNGNKIIKILTGFETQLTQIDKASKACSLATRLILGTKCHIGFEIS